MVNDVSPIHGGPLPVRGHPGWYWSGFWVRLPARRVRCQAERKSTKCQCSHTAKYMFKQGLGYDYPLCLFHFQKGVFADVADISHPMEQSA